jgi:hypothetical protein
MTEAIRSGLAARGATVYVDNRSLQAGDYWPDQLLAAQKASRVTIALVSSHTVTSVWFKSEYVTGLTLMSSGLAHAVVPIFIDATEIPYGLNVVQGIRLTEGVTGEVLDRLMAALGEVRDLAGAA